MSDREMKINVNGTSYDVKVGDLNASPVEVTVNGKVYHVDLGQQTTVAASRPVSAPVAAPKPVSVPAVPAPAPAPVAAPQGGGNADEVRAPLPGIVRDILVKPGEQVTAGQQLLALEAMKMKNAIRSPRDGVVASIEVAEGKRVAFSELLIKLS